MNTCQAPVVADLMSSNVALIREDHSLYAAARQMRESNLPQVCVESDEGVVGVLTAEAIERALPSDEFDPEGRTRALARIAISDVLEKDFWTVTPGTALAYATNELARRGLEAVPVVALGRLTGVLSRAACLAWVERAAGPAPASAWEGL